MVRINEYNIAIGSEFEKNKILGYNYYYYHSENDQLVAASKNYYE